MIFCLNKFYENFVRALGINFCIVSKENFRFNFKFFCKSIFKKSARALGLKSYFPYLT